MAASDAKRLNLICVCGAERFFLFSSRARVQMALFYIYDASFPFILKGVGGVKM
jgi:hypothetical protein